MNIAELERETERWTGTSVAIEEDGNALVVTGMIGSEEERQAIFDVLRQLAPGRELVDNLDRSMVLPGQLGSMQLASVQGGGRTDSEPGLSDDEAIEPGDFTDQEILSNPAGASGPGYTAADEEISEGDEVYVPPTDEIERREDEV